MSKNEIKLVQIPIIQHKLQEFGKSVSKRIEELELDKQIATVETVKSLKDLRAELNKELADLENQRKFIKESINNPYLEFENVYKTEISEKYKSAIDTLKYKIDFVETKVKSEKKQSIETYFNELCIAESIDFIKFDKLGIDINLSTTEKKYKEQVYDYISKIVDDLQLIKSTDFEAEILTEYKLTLNVSNAITTVKTRKENEAKEKARIKAERTQQRKAYITNVLEMGFVEITNAYEFNADVYITVDEIENLSNEDYIKKTSDLEVKINELKKVESNQNSVSNDPKEVVTETTTKKSPPVARPIISKEPEPLKKASFEVTATMTQLRALGAYMKENNITYKNI